MTLIELVVVVVILGLAATGLGFSVGALTRTSLKSAAAKLAAAVRYSYNRAVSHGTTVRIVFDLPGNKFAVEEAHGRITLARNEEFRRVHGVDMSKLDTGGAVDPWAVARARLEKPLEPSLGGSPFGPIEGARGEPVKRFTKIDLGRHIQIVRLLVPHEPGPKEEGQGAVHFFPTGYSEHAVIHLSDGGEGVYAVEIHPLTGRTKIHASAFEPEEFLDDPENLDVTEVDE